MAARNDADAWQSQWQALQEHFLGGWTDQLKSAPGAGANPWADGYQAWAKMFGGAGGGTAPMANEALERATAGTRQFLEFLQAAAGGASTPGAWSESLQKAFGAFTPDSNPVLDAIRQATGQSARGFQDLHAQLAQFADPARREFGALTSMPAFGYSRERQEHAQAMARASADYADQLQKYNALMLKASQRGVALFESKLAERSEPGRELSSLRALYDLWIDAAEEGYAEVALSDEFREAYGALVNAQSRLQKLVHESVERQTAALGIPTRSEVNGSHRKIAELSRRLRKLERALGEPDSHAHAPVRERGARTGSSEGRAVEIEDRAGAEATREQTAKGAANGGKPGKPKTAKARAATRVARKTRSR